MASITVIVCCLFVSLLMLEARGQSNFVTVNCQKSEIVAQFGTNTLLDCSVKSRSSDVNIETVVWKLNGVTLLIFHEQEVKSYNSSFKFAMKTLDGSDMNVSLLITDTNLSHDGEYHCEVSTDSGTGETQVRVTVKSNYSKPIIDSDPKKITHDKDFTLTCEAHGGFPEGKIRWVVDGHAWNNNPKEEVIKQLNGLYNLSSKLSFGPESPFTKFVCEVYNAKGVKEDKATFEKTSSDQITGPETKGHSVTQIVAPVVVIGSLIVGLLVAVLLCRRKQQIMPPVSAEECNAMV